MESLATFVMNTKEINGNGIEFIFGFCLYNRR